MAGPQRNDPRGTGRGSDDTTAVPARGVLETLVVGGGAKRGGTQVAGAAPRGRPGHSHLHLVDLCSDFLALVAAVRHADGAAEPVALRRRALELKTTLEQRAREIGIPSADVETATFALVALLDETVLRSRGAAKDAWMRTPLQLELYGQTVAGEEFYERLDALRRDRSGRIEALEVCCACLALGFGGRHNLAGPEKLAEILAEVGRDVQAVRGAPPRSLSPHLDPGGEYADAGGTGVPIWLSTLAFVLGTALVWLVIKLLAAHGAAGMAAGIAGLGGR
jgi:type VI secretion system protein ImpK